MDWILLIEYHNRVDRLVAKKPKALVSLPRPFPFPLGFFMAVSEHTRTPRHRAALERPAPRRGPWRRARRSLAGPPTLWVV